MNIFDVYLNKIKNLIIKLNKNGILEVPESLNGINVDVPPSELDYDISTNVAMVLSKCNKKPSLDIANQLCNFIKKENVDIDTISVAKPGFINIKFKTVFWNNFIKEIINNNENFGVNKNEKKK